MQWVSYRFKQLSILGLASVALGGFLTAPSTANAALTTVGVDPASPWQGFMNVFELPSNGGGFDFSSSWGTADLPASFTGPTLKIGANTNIDSGAAATDAFWWQSGGTGAGNHIMDASYYVQSDAIAGQTVEFNGNVLSNTLVSPYTSVAFIKDFNSNFSSLIGSTTVPLVNGVFDISLATQPGDHIQYGFETKGPNARNAAAPGLGSVSVTAVPEPATLGLIGALGIPALLRRRKV